MSLACLERSDRRVGGGEVTVDDRQPRHEPPFAVEHVLYADVVPAGDDVLILVSGGRTLGAANPIDVLIGVPILKEHPPAVVVFLRQRCAADVEHTTTAGGGQGHRGGAGEQNKGKRRCGQRREEACALVPCSPGYNRW